MFATSCLVEKSFEIWPGKLSFAAAGGGAREALDVAMDVARDLSRPVLADAELLATGQENVLPRGRAGRIAVETAARFHEALPQIEFPPSLAAMPGAICDVILEGMYDAAQASGGVDSIVVSLGDVIAVHQEPGVAGGAGGVAPPLLGEFVSALGEGVQGGAAIAGSQSAFPTSGPLDIVAVQSKSAAMAGFAAATVADASADAVSVSKGASPRDRLFAFAWRDHFIAGPAGLVDAELVWQALSVSVRQAAALRDKQFLRAAALGFKGRGRTTGPVDGDRLLRFGVSEWR
ncbi:hypothetical protein [Parvibaculum sp.]|uniref:hypothetical protein n=1 Tax=Parvibaculum sp. TaxID=2024848 RepID=UPI003296EAC8